MSELQRAKIIKVLERDNNTPKSLHRWMREITYYPEFIQKSYQAIMFYDNGNKMTRTSYVVDIQEDENNLVFTTENSIYYLKKFI